jgi:hypothetical protein
VRNSYQRWRIRFCFHRNFTIIATATVIISTLTLTTIIPIYCANSSAGI